MNSLLISDLHLTGNPRDEYRWRLFDWLSETCPKHGVKELFVLGDLTEAKDYHSARLVNRVVSAFVRLFRSTNLLAIYILRGNHDGIDPACAYFRFLGNFPFIKYIETPFMFPSSGREVLMLPHTADPMRAWESVDFHAADLIFMHATVKGAISETGYTLEGVPLGMLSLARRATIYSGDVHVPQKVGRVEYVGAPYPIRFGDSFQGRAILLEDMKKATTLTIPSIQKLVLEAGAEGLLPKTAALARPGDQAKVRVRLARAEFGDWRRIKEKVVAECSRLKIELCGLELVREEEGAEAKTDKPQAEIKQRSHETVLTDFCQERKLPQQIQAAGHDLLLDLLEK